MFLYADPDMQQLGAGAAPYLIANENNALPFALDVFGGGNTVNLGGIPPRPSIRRVRPGRPAS